MRRTALQPQYLRKSLSNNGKGFTLVELLIVISILAILAIVVFIVINPLELMRRGRDSARFADLTSLQNVINVSVQEATSSGLAVLCNNQAAPCVGRSTDTGNVRSPDGTGWVKANLTVQRSVSVPTLPIDPVNSSVFHYTYCSDGETWEIDTALESDQFRSKMGGDGGDENDPSNNYANARYEVGSSLTLINPSGSCQY